MAIKLKEYLTTLITEKGRSVDDEIQIDGHFGLTWQMLIDFIEIHTAHHDSIYNMLVYIDFKNGDVFDYLTHLTKGMLEACDY